MEGYQQLFALTKNSKYVKMRPPGKAGRPSEWNNTANAGRIVSKPKRQEDSSCVFAWSKFAALATAAIPQKKRKRRNCIGTDQKKEVLQKAVRTVRRKNRQGRGKLPSLYAAVRVRHRIYGVSHILRSVAGRITGHRRSLPQPSSAAWWPPPLYWSRVHSSHVASY